MSVSVSRLKAALPFSISNLGVWLLSSGRGRRRAARILATISSWRSRTNKWSKPIGACLKGLLPALTPGRCRREADERKEEQQRRHESLHGGDYLRGYAAKCTR
jgi:hypothetical protein